MIHDFFKIFQLELQVLDEAVIVTRKEFDICDIPFSKMPEILKSNLIGWGIPNYCPVNETSTFCYKGNKMMTYSSVSQKLLGFFVTTNTRKHKIRITIKHDTGLSCFEGESKVSRIVA